MNKIQLGEWFYENSVSTDNPDIYLIELKKGERKWYSRFDLKKFLFIDLLPPDCVPNTSHLAEANAYFTSIAI